MIMSELASFGKELLILLVWCLDKTSRPTLRNLTESWEEWEHRTRIREDFRRLEKRQWLVRESNAGRTEHRLTPAGRLAALGGREPAAQWSRRWDGAWRMLLFDLPVSHAQTRMRLWRWLRANHFGYLQQSVWITPDPLGELSAALARFREDVEFCTVMESRCAAGYTNSALVLGAWDFVQINQRYREYLECLRTAPRPKSRGAKDSLELFRWLREERLAWETAVWPDPLLPRELCPADYVGQEAWKAKSRILSELAGQVAD